MGGAGAGLREANPGARKTGAPGASVCLFKCQGLRSRPAARSRIYNPVPPAPALVARPVQAGAADRGKPSYLLLLFSSCSTFREICVRGCTAASVNRHCPHHLHFLGCYAAVRSGKGRNASFPAAWLRPGPRWERRHCGAHTCELALEVSGCGRAPLPVPQGFHLSASESAQVALAPAPGPQ